jgi:hypothetical protein
VKQIDIRIDFDNRSYACITQERRPDEAAMDDAEVGVR